MLQIIIFLLCVVAASLLISLSYKDIRNLIISKRPLSKVSVKSNEATLNLALHELNCNCTWEDFENGRLVKYIYQSGHFQIYLEPTTPFARMSFLFIFEAPMAQINLVRTICNTINQNAEVERVFYSFNEKDGCIDVHASCALLLHASNAGEVLAHAMDRLFDRRQSFTHQFNMVMDESRKAPDNDIEDEADKMKRMQYLLREQEMNHQKVPNGQLPAESRDTTLGHLICATLSLNDFEPTQLLVQTEVQTVYDKGQSDEIKNFKLESPLIENHRFVRDVATLTLTFTSASAPQKPLMVVVSLKAETASPQALYYRATLTRIPLSLDSDVSLFSLRHQAMAHSLLLAHDLTTEKHRSEEFAYMWAEAGEKMDNGEESQLTEEQKLIAGVTHPQTAQDLYRGKQLLLAGRCFEALPPLTDAFNSLHSMFSSLNAKEIETFFQLCYHIGFAHCELKQYRQAYYYLDIIAAANRIDFAEEYVNCMANSGDFRALSVIDGLLNHVEPGDDDEPEPHVERFIHFLRRRKAYVLINSNRLDEAEKLLKPMLNQPDNADFAISELAYIQKLRAN